MSAAILTLTALSQRFGGVTAVDGVNWDIPEGRIIGLIGPNGAGKTTLLHLISGVQKPIGGRILFRGREITGMPAHRRARLGISRTFQIVRPLLGMSVIENVATAALFGKRGCRRTVGEATGFAAEVLQRVGLWSKRRHPMRALTLADTKRLELAKALACEPDLLLLDEVMAGLNQQEILGQIALIRDLNASGLTLIVVEHVMKAIMSVSDEIMVLHHGQRIAYGPPAQIVDTEEVIRAYLGQRYARSR